MRNTAARVCGSASWPASWLSFAFLVVVLTLVSPSEGLPESQDVLTSICQDACKSIDGFAVLQDFKCYCTRDHDPTEAELEAVKHAEETCQNHGITLTMGVSQEVPRIQRCLLGRKSPLRIYAANDRERPVLSQPAVVTVIREPQVVTLPLSAFGRPVQANVVVAARDAQEGVASPPPGPAGKGQVATVLTVAGPLSVEQGKQGASGTSTLREQIKQQARAMAAAVQGAPSSLLAGAASASSPRFAVRDIVVSPVRTGTTFIESPTGAFSSMAGSLPGSVGGAYSYSAPSYQTQQQTFEFMDPGLISDGSQYMRSVSEAAQRAADTGVVAADTAMQHATKLASTVTGAGLDAAKTVVDTGRWTTNQGLRMADDALDKAKQLGDAALRSQMRAAEQTAQFLLPPNAAAGRNDQARHSSDLFPPSFSLSVMNPGSFYPDVRAAVDVQASASSPQTSMLSQRSLDSQKDATPAGRSSSIGMDISRFSMRNSASDVPEARGVLTDAATATAGAIENAAYNVAQGVQSGAHAVASTVSNVFHGVQSGVHSGAQSAAGLAQDAYHGVASGVQSGVHTVSEAAHGVASGVQSGVQAGASTIAGVASTAVNTAGDIASTAGHGIQHAAHQITGLGHSAADDAMARAAEASAMAKDALQTAASQAVEAVQAVQSATNQGVNAAQGAQEAALRGVYNLADKVQGQVQDVAGRVQDQVQQVAGKVRGGSEDLQHAVKSTVLDAQTAARDAILAAASQGTASGQKMTQGALDAAQAAVSTAIEKVKMAMKMGTSSARNSVGLGLGGLRSAYSGLQQGLGNNQMYSQQGLGNNQMYSQQGGLGTSAWAAQQAIDGLASDAANVGLGVANSGMNLAVNGPRRISHGGLGLAQAAVSSLPLGWAGRSAANFGLGLAQKSASPGGSASWHWSPAGTTVTMGAGGPAEGGFDVSMKHQPLRDPLHTPVYRP